jgi:hypothetical protein
MPLYAVVPGGGPAVAHPLAAIATARTQKVRNVESPLMVVLLGRMFSAWGKTFALPGPIRRELRYGIQDRCQTA